MSRNRAVIYGAAAAIALAALGANAWSIASLQTELQVLADQKAAEFHEASTEPLRIASDVTVTKAYVVAGAINGKVRLFMEPLEGDAPLQGFEFFYAREADQTWRMTESGRCTSEQCTIDGKRLLERVNAKARESNP